MQLDRGLSHTTCSAFGRMIPRPNYMTLPKSTYDADVFSLSLQLKFKMRCTNGKASS